MTRSPNERLMLVRDAAHRNPLHSHTLKRRRNTATSYTNTHGRAIAPSALWPYSAPAFSICQTSNLSIVFFTLVMNGCSMYHIFAASFRWIALMSTSASMW